MPAAIPLAMVAGSAIAGAVSAHSANKAADAATKSNDKALDFEKQRDAEDRQQFDTTQRANYDQYLNRYNAAKQLGSEYGFNLPDAKPYVSVNGQSAPQGQPNGQDPAAFIRQYQQTHSPSEGPQGVMNAMKQAGFNVSPYMYGQTPSNNEISLNGEKYKVIGAEGTPNAYWYQAGMNDGAPRSNAPVFSSAISSYLQQPAQPQQTFRLAPIAAYRA